MCEYTWPIFGAFVCHALSNLSHNSVFFFSYTQLEEESVERVVKFLGVLLITAYIPDAKQEHVFDD
jgi:hypothetical protein